MPMRNTTKNARSSRPTTRSTLVLLLLVTATLFACTSERSPEGPTEPSPLRDWRRPTAPVGAIHNQILAAYEETAPVRPFETRFREAVLDRVSTDAGPDAAQVAEVEQLLEGPAFDEIQRRLREARRLLTEGHPDASALERLLRSWDVEPDAARRLGETIASVLLDRQLPPSLGKAPPSRAEAVFHDVFEHSAEYWSRRDGLAKTAPESEVSAFDALGALGGLAFGPIGAIIGGAAYSIVWRSLGAEQEATGGCGDCH